MKKIWILSFMMFVTFSLFAQKIKKNEIDRFTNTKVIETSTERLYSKTFMLSGFSDILECCVRKTGDSYTMPTNILTPDVVKFTENDGIIILLDNKETVILKTSYTGISGQPWAKGYWFETCFELTPDQIEILKNNKVVAIRVSYLGGYYDYDVKGKNQSKISKMIKLVESEK